jgi:tyrosine phenol-lyase
MIKNEPYKIKSVRNLEFVSTAERRNILRNVFFNINHITNSIINFDMISQGSSAMSQEQVSSLFLGDEAYAGARNFNTLVRQVNETFGLKYVCPIHNRYGGLKLLSSIMVTRDSVIGGNTDLPRPVVEYYGGNYENFDEEIEDFINKNSRKIAFI